MDSPGYAHMSQTEIDQLVEHAESVFRSMFEAITTNHGLGTERVDSLLTALDYVLSKETYRQSFRTWRSLSEVGLQWTQAKILPLLEVRDNLEAEKAKRAR
jgi:hypothetical protein